MSKYLIVYGTKEGQTAKISDRIGEIVRQRGHKVDIHDARKIPSTFKFEGYSGAIIGSSIHMGQYSSPVIQFAKQYKSQLEGVPSTFFSVSMQAASATPEQRAQLDPWIQKFLNKCGWHPKTYESFAGRLAYTQYGWFTKWLIKTINRSKDPEHAGDTSHDIEYTNWDQVTKFANDFIDSTQNTPNEGTGV
jgi:menaquinone-dependent protoporphyrinogen oxidase